MLSIWEDSITDANLVSRGGIHTNPDEDNYAGTAGEAKTQKLIMAPAQTTLAADIDDVQTIISLNGAVFDDSRFPYIVVVSGANSEIMTITAGFGKTTVTVTRGDTPISAEADDSVFNAYTYHDLTILASDESGTDYSSWITYAPDVAGSPGSYVTSLSPADITNPKTGTYTFWRKITVPVASAGRDGTMRHKTIFEAFEYAA